VKSLSELVEAASMSYAESLELLNELAPVLNQEAVEAFAAANSTPEDALVKVLESEQLIDEILDQVSEDSVKLTEVCTRESPSDLGHNLAISNPDFGARLLDELSYWRTHGRI